MLSVIRSRLVLALALGLALDADSIERVQEEDGQTAPDRHREALDALIARPHDREHDAARDHRRRDAVADGDQPAGGSPSARAGRVDSRSSLGLLFCHEFVPNPPSRMFAADVQG